MSQPKSLATGAVPRRPPAPASAPEDLSGPVVESIETAGSALSAFRPRPGPSDTQLALEDDLPPAKPKHSS